MTMSKASAMDKVLKLLAKSNGTNNQEEAATFAAGAAAIIRKFNLDAAELEKAGKQAKSGYDHKVLGTAEETWKQHLGFALARNNFCKAILIKVPRPKGRGFAPALDCIGQPENLEIVEYLYTYLRRTIDKMGYTSYEAASYEERSGGTKSQWWTVFCYGAAVCIANRLDADRRQATENNSAEASDIRALIVVKDADLAKATSEIYPHLTHKRQRAQRSHDAAFSSGYEAGKSLHLNRALEGK